MRPRRSTNLAGSIAAALLVAQDVLIYLRVLAYLEAEVGRRHLLSLDECHRIRADGSTHPLLQVREQRQGRHGC